jgi:hypothetical protein
MVAMPIALRRTPVRFLQLVWRTATEDRDGFL